MQELPYEEKLVDSPEARRLADKLRPDLETVRGAPAKAADLVVAMRNEVHQAQIDNTWRLTPAGVAEIENGIRNRALQALDDLEQSCQAAKERMERALRDAEARPEGDAQSRILAELQEQRAWGRIRPLLERLETSMLVQRIADLAAQAAERGDDATLRALESETPGYLDYRGVSSLATAALDGIGRARAPHLTPAGRLAVQVRQELAVGWPRLVAAIQQARREATGKGGRTVALPGWKPGETLTF